MTVRSEIKDNSERGSVILFMKSGVSALPKTFILLSKHQVFISAVLDPHLLSSLHSNHVFQ